MSEIKQATFRLNDEDINAFREMTDKSGMNQAEMFQGLLNAFEMSRARNQIGDRGKEIDTFQTTVNTLMGMFLNSLAINQTSEERIRETLSLELNTKDTTIKDLQEEKKKLKEEVAALRESLDTKAKIAKVAENELEKLSKETEAITEKLNKDLAEKSETINSLQGQLQTLNEIIAEYKPYKDTNVGLEDKLKELSKTIADLTAANKDMNSQLNNETKMKEFYEKEVKDLKISIEKINAETRTLDQHHKQEFESLDQEHREELKLMEQHHKQELKAMDQQHKQELQALELKMKDSYEKEVGGLKGSIEKLNNESKDLEQKHKQEIEQLENKHKEELAAVEVKHQSIIDKEIINLKKNFDDKLQLEKEKLDFAKAKNEAELENIKSKYNDLKEKHDAIINENDKSVIKVPKATKKKNNAPEDKAASKEGKES